MSKKKPGRIPAGLAQVRKELPPPGKIFKSKKSKEKLRRELMEFHPRKPS